MLILYLVRPSLKVLEGLDRRRDKETNLTKTKDPP